MKGEDSVFSDELEVLLARRDPRYAFNTFFIATLCWTTDHDLTDTLYKLFITDKLTLPNLSKLFINIHSDEHDDRLAAILECFPRTLEKIALGNPNEILAAHLIAGQEELKALSSNRMFTTEGFFTRRQRHTLRTIVIRHMQTDQSQLFDLNHIRNLRSLTLKSPLINVD